MANIGGNINGVIQTKTAKTDETGAVVKNEIGEAETTWADAFNHLGWLDLQSGDSDYVNHKTKMEESTHVFLCDFHSGIYALADQDTRMIIKGNTYDVLLIDNPMEMNEQLEIYLRKVGAWNG
jgi:hypothetical protein